MLSKNIRELRTECGLTQAELARKIGVTQGAVYFWEKGINEPTAGYLIKMATLFEISVDELLSFECKKKGERSTKEVEMLRVFGKLSAPQQEVVLATAKEFIKL
jgi:transcriptional regulator with XRE-family HTH domain